jgi:hypothetical protein
MSAVTVMMKLRQAGLEEIASAPTTVGPPFRDLRVEAADHLTPGGPGVPGGPAGAVPQSLASAVADRLARNGGPGSPGAAVVSGLARFFPIEQAREFHEALFNGVWPLFARRAGHSGESANFRIKTGIIADGMIPRELYGSEWSFKSLHIDRDALLFSHLYGPVSGCEGGAVLLVDVARYMSARSLRFSDVFEWSQEPTEGSKPVLRAEHGAAAMAECGVSLGPIGPDEILFVNNLPDAGVLHGATPVAVTDPASFRREYHRCSVKDLRLC